MFAVFIWDILSQYSYTPYCPSDYCPPPAQVIMECEEERARRVQLGDGLG